MEGVLKIDSVTETITYSYEFSYKRSLITIYLSVNNCAYWICKLADITTAQPYFFDAPEITKKKVFNDFIRKIKQDILRK